MSESAESAKQKRKLMEYHPSAFLLGAQLLQLILYAAFDENIHQHTLISTFSVVVLMLVIWVVDRSSTIPWLKWSLAIPAFILAIFATIFNNEALVAWSALLNSVLYFFAAVNLIIYMLSDDRVTTDEIFAIGAAFTLLAWGFAYLFMVCQLWVPNSFVSSVVSGRKLVFIELLFTSFTNLSATGLGDIVPTSAWSRALASLEQMAGVGYVAIVVSRLVGMTTRKRTKKLE